MHLREQAHRYMKGHKCIAGGGTQHPLAMQRSSVAYVLPLNTAATQVASYDDCVLFCRRRIVGFIGGMVLDFCQVLSYTVQQAQEPVCTRGKVPRNQC